MLNNQSTSQPATLPNYHKNSAPSFTQASRNARPPIPQSKPPPVSNKPSHFTAPPEWKPPPLPTVAQKVPPPKAPKPINKPSANVNHPDVSEKPPLPPPPSHKSPNKPDLTNEIINTDSSSSLDAGGQAPRSKSRLPPGLDIAVLTRINPELDYNAQDFAHKDSIDRRKKDQEASHPAVPVFSPDGSDTTREFVPPSGSNSELTQQTSMEEEKDKIMAYIKNRKVENKISNDGIDPLICPVPAEVEAKHQKKHQEKQLRKSLRNKLKRVMPNGREKRDKDSEMPNANWQWSKDSAPPISSAEVKSPSSLPPTSRDTINNSTSSLPSSNGNTKCSNTTMATVAPSNRDIKSSDVMNTSLSSGEIRGSGVGMEVEQSSSTSPPQQQYKDTSSSITTTATTIIPTASVVDHSPVLNRQQQQREWNSPSKRTIPPRTAPKPSPPIAPKPSILQKPALKPHPFAAAKKPSPPIAPKPQRDQLLNNSSHEADRQLMPTDQSRTAESQKLVEQPHPPIPMQLQALTTQ